MKCNSANTPIIVSSLLAVVIVGGFFVWGSRNSTPPQDNPSATPTLQANDPYSPENIRSTLLSYLAQPAFIGRTIEQQVLGEAQLELLQVDDQEAYFSVPKQKTTTRSLEKRIEHFVIDATQTKFANVENGKLWLGQYSLLQTPEKWDLFKTSVSNIKVAPNAVLQFPFDRAIYKLNMRELIDFLTNKSVMGGLLNAQADQSVNDRITIFANHGAFVAKAGEPSLRRLVDDLTKNIPNDEMARERKVQHLLDFVTKEIAYDQREATYDIELLKRPNEVLMSRQSDCSNKVILLASLLEQLNEDYLLVYMPHHITIAVPQGRFPNQNGLALQWENKTWLIAETTATNFRIGIDHLNDEEGFKQLQYVQRPSQKNSIFNVVSGRQISFY